MNHFSLSNEGVTEINFDDPFESYVRPAFLPEDEMSDRPFNPTDFKQSDLPVLQEILTKFIFSTKNHIIPFLEEERDFNTIRLVRNGILNSLNSSSQFKFLNKNHLMNLITNTEYLNKKFNLVLKEEDSKLFIYGLGKEFVCVSPKLPFYLTVHQEKLERKIPYIGIRDHTNFFETFPPKRVEIRTGVSTIPTKKEAEELVGLIKKFKQLLSKKGSYKSRKIAKTITENLTVGLINSQIGRHEEVSTLVNYLNDY